MENIQNTEIQEIEEKNHRNLVRRERIGKTFGSAYMRVVAILYTVYIAIDLFAGFINATSCTSDIILQSSSWLGLMITRFVPNIITCVCLWLVFSTAHNKHEVNSFALKVLMWLMIVLGVAVLIHLVGGTLAIIFREDVYSFEGLNYFETVTLTLVIFITLNVIKILLYVIMTISLRSLIKDKVCEAPMKLGKLCGVLLIIFGGIYALSMVSLYNIFDAIIETFHLNSHAILQYLIFIYENPLNYLLIGITMVFLGVVILLFNNRKETE